MASVPRDVLLDTGPLVAVLDAGDPWHSRCLAVWPSVIARCVTTEAVVAEACHLVARSGGAVSAPLRFLLRGEIPIVALPRDGQSRVAALMERYADVPMDYADGTLAALGEALQTATIFTTDRRGFTTYRLPARKRFALLPE